MVCGGRPRCNKDSWSTPSWMCTSSHPRSPRTPWDPCSVQSAVGLQSPTHSPEICCQFFIHSVLTDATFQSYWVNVQLPTRAQEFLLGNLLVFRSWAPSWCLAWTCETAVVHSQSEPRCCSEGGAGLGDALASYLTRWWWRLWLKPGRSRPRPGRLPGTWPVGPGSLSQGQPAHLSGGATNQKLGAFRGTLGEYCSHSLQESRRNLRWWDFFQIEATGRGFL